MMAASARRDVNSKLGTADPPSSMGTIIMRFRPAIVILLFMLTSMTAVVATAQPPDPQDDAVLLSFPPNSPITHLIAYVADRLDLNIIYDEAQANQRITLRSAQAVPKGALLDVLRTVLRSRNLVLEETDVAEMLRIVPAQELPQTSRIGMQGLGDTVTEIFELDYARAEQLVGLLQPFLTKPGGNAIATPAGSSLIVTDFQNNILKLGSLIDALDAGEPTIVESVLVSHADARLLLQSLQPFLQSQQQVTPGNTRPIVTVDARTNRVLIVGLSDQVNQLALLLRELDQPAELERRVYRPQSLPVDRLNAYVQQVLRRKPSEFSYRAAADPEANILVVTAPPDIQDEISSLLTEIDLPPAAVESPLRFYRLTNALARDVLDTLRSLEGERGLMNAGSTAVEVAAAKGHERSGIPSVFQPLQDSRSMDYAARSQSESGISVANGAESSAPNLGESAIPTPAPNSLLLSSINRQERPIVAMDENSNSIIVIAPPSQQRLYASIIQQLDRRRPQVLVEATIATLDTSNGFTLGVDIAAGEDVDNGRIISFSAFGISEVDATGPNLSPLSALGGTFALLKPDVADVVIRALATNNHSKLTSIPRVLVNDNQPARLRSENEVPFQQSVAPDGDFVFSSADYATAGTTINVTPHISEGSYLQLEYAVQLSSFTAGPAAQDLPPPRQTNEIESVVTIPDGYTIVVGGLNTSNLTESIQKVPLLGDIPLIKHLFRSQSRNLNNMTLFVFIRPQILRDNGFADLKNLSRLDRETAGLDPDYPLSQPMILEPGVIAPSPQ